MIQIKGQADDPLIARVEAYARKIGLSTVATAARILLAQALDQEERRSRK